ncbi:hypothetical protein OZ664_11140 [Elizabethkingia sp. HX WHF]|uniref:hypothetical protein n=1 Tax=Elizabethkingia TaxID=308865 RepID=UPI000998F627|nr:MULTISPECIES: hypothetical protein [Elizabethkingia]ATL43495.1 hypothetical protein CQS02_09370 [Elizabethkingia miricola]MCL1638415.1 hypothetical protein [Elizabethkingia bruuniana]MDX8564557.1 hypothetical protein [Elizabethkingia sp. HX WHF]OPC26338.1 hypothetical protein BAY00_03270 [Elizabethkingia bruuniana]
METKNQKFQELLKKMETLKETEKGQLKGGFSSSVSFGPISSSIVGNNCVCTNRDGALCMPTTDK